MYRTEKQGLNNQVIKTIRTKLNLSQQEMAALLGTERGWLSKVERGLETPDWLTKFAVLLRLLNEAGLTWEDVVMEFPEPVSSRAAMARESSAEYKVE